MLVQDSSARARQPVAGTARGPGNEPQPATLATSAKPARSEYRKYWRTRYAIPLVLVAYLAIAIWRERVAGQGEIFPFASWSLFTLVPNDKSDFSVRILGVNGSELPRPAFFEESRVLFPAATDHGAIVTIELLGNALVRGDEVAVERIRARFERLFLRDAREVEYEVVARTYDPMKRYTTGEITAVRVLRSFQTSAP